MIAVQRRNKIKEMLFQERSVRVTELARQFEVSEETIRRDLGQLESEGLVQKNYGGAVLVEDVRNAMSVIPPVHQRKLFMFEEKDAIGKKAASLVQSGQVVLLDAGSTTWCVARHLRQHKDLTVVTNGINVAEELSQSEDIGIFVIGGQLVKKSMSLVGPQMESEILKYNADIAFVGTSGISLVKGFTSSDIYEAEVKQAIVRSAEKVVIVADHHKFDRPGLVAFCSFQDIDYLVTNDSVDRNTITEIERYGVKVLVG